MPRNAVDKILGSVLSDRDPFGPGLAASVLRDGQALASRCWGCADIQSRQPITPTTIFHLASEGKQFTGLPAAMLLQAGVLCLTDPVAKVLKDVPPYIACVPIAHLVHHTSGVPDYYEAFEKGGLFARGCDGQDVMRFLASQASLDFPPGTKFHYSNSNYFLLARIVETLCGQGFGDFLQERLFGPLGMCDTSLYPPSDGRSARLAIGHAGNRTDGYSHWDYPHAHIPGPGHVCSTLEDLVRFEASLADPQGPLTQLYGTLFRTGQLLDGSPVRYAFGLDWGVYTPQDKGYAVAHAGACAGQCGGILRMPEERLSVIVLCNCRDIPHLAMAWDLVEATRRARSG